ncbi:MAG: pseudouridine synthase [Planctomycetaceae bacterium]
MKDSEATPSTSKKTDGETAPPVGERLQKVLAAAGIGSRRHCEELILAGRVTVGRDVVSELGVRVDPSQEKICVDTVPIRVEKKRYFLLFKPRHCVCTAHDPAGRLKAIDLLPQDFGRLFTVGRLDENSEGLLLVTNDGELAHRLAHPRFQVERRYRVLVAGQPTGAVLAQLKQGQYFHEGKFRVRDVRRIAGKGQSTVLELTLTEGQNREIRRLLARVGHKVMALRRIAFGPLLLGALEPGDYRPLSGAEIKALRDFTLGKKPRSTDTPGAPRRKPGGPRKQASTPKTSERPTRRPTRSSSTSKPRRGSKKR